MRRVYMDNAATTALAPEAARAMEAYWKEVYGNPSSVHAEGRAAHRAVDAARAQVAAAINAKAPEIYFTAGGSEGDNWAIKGAAFARREKGRHLITTAIEHHAVLHAFAWLEKQGFQVTYLPVDAEGLVNPRDVEKAVTNETTLISVMMANNEVGAIQPVREIGRIARARGVLFHTDAVQAVGAIPVDVEEIGCDMLSMSGHKFHGPKGVGALYIRQGVRLDNLIHGGAQERGRRAGTENVPGIVGMGAAIQLATENLAEKSARVARLRDELVDGLLSRVPYSRLNGSRSSRLPGNCNLTIRAVEGEALLLRLDLAGVAASSGSACTSGSLDPSHVLLAMGLTDEAANSSLRLTLSTDTTEADVQTVLDVLPPIVRDLRAMRPDGARLL